MRGASTSPWSRKDTFITPIAPRSLTVPDNDPRRRSACQRSGLDHCPKMLVYGGNGRGGLPTIDPAKKARVPNVRVSFVLQRVQVVGDAAAWLDPTDLYFYIEWWTHSPSADVEEETGMTVDGSIQLDEQGYFHTPPVIYDALALNACNGFSSFPIDHRVVKLEADGLVATPFEGHDATTIDSTGYYSFSYTIPIDAEDGSAHSGLHLSGKINVTCTSTGGL